ncbi:MAG: nitroreductase family deazaflavin-dependent oxidoreductase [Dehalococcoidia bacterium]|nr:nitroreductase family deazaflavin-dependent oxidoreductase [Dehalococcoidia bacterium]
MLKRIVIVAAVVGGLLFAWVRIPRRSFYGPTGPTVLGRATNRVMVLWSGSGLPPHRQQVLEVRGRKTGKPRSVPVVVATVDGDRYLVAMLGPGTAWVANAREAGVAVLRHRRREDVLLDELPAEDEAKIPVLREYLRLASGARPFFPAGPDAPAADFLPVLERHPVFRIVPLG